MLTGLMRYVEVTMINWQVSWVDYNGQFSQVVYTQMDFMTVVSFINGGDRGINSNGIVSIVAIQ